MVLFFSDGKGAALGLFCKMKFKSVGPKSPSGAHFPVKNAKPAAFS
jgi:hypothetical protein